MALSDYAQLVVNHQLEPVSGRIALPSGKAFQFYKNWIYLYDSIDAEYCCGSIYGTSIVEWGGATFITQRTKAQRGIMGVVSVGWGDTRQAWAGIGVSAYPKGLWHDLFGGIEDYCGVGLRVAREMNRWLRRRHLTYFTVHQQHWWQVRAHFYREHDVVEGRPFREFDFTKAAYRNQGDDYIEAQIGTPEGASAIPVGKVRKPLFHYLLGK